MVTDENRIVRRYCDKPMAEKKGYLPCDERCRQCHACIEVTKGGDKRHFTPKYGTVTFAK